MNSALSQQEYAQHAMPGFVRDALDLTGLDAAYAQRPSYQQNAYIGWICTPTQSATQHKRLMQMLDELARGDVYMNRIYKGEADEP